MLTQRKRTGNAGEALAAKFLEARRYRILARQAAVPRVGEIDLVALDGATLVFVEVKTRHDRSFGSPEEAVTATKLRTLAACAESWRQTHGWFARSYRLDVIAVDCTGAEPRLRHLQDVHL